LAAGAYIASPVQQQFHGSVQLLRYGQACCLQPVFKSSGQHTATITAMLDIAGAGYAANMCVLAHLMLWQDY